MTAVDEDGGEQPPVMPGEKLGAAWRKLRREKLADREFRRKAAQNPLTRPIATASAKRLFDFTAGFVYSQILKAVVELDLLDKVATEAKTPEELAEPLGLKPEAARTLLDAAAALDLVERLPNGAYEIAALGSALQGEEGVRAMIAHHDMLYADLADPVKLLRGEAGQTKLSRFWPYAGGGADTVGEEASAPYSELMGTSQSFVADDVLDVFSFGDRNSLIDLGGGDGSFVESVAKRWDHLKIAMADLPAVAARAERRLKDAGLGDRISVHGLDFFADRPPGEADVVSFVRVLHDHDDERVLGLLKLAHDSLTQGGEVMIAEPIADMPNARRVGHAYFGFYLLAMGSGRPRTSAEITDLLQRAGFWSVRTRYARGALPLAVITARRRSEGPLWRF